MSGKGKVISLADRRRDPLDIQWRERTDAPASRDRYDAWIETDGSLVMRIAAEHAHYQKRPAEYGPEDGPPVFTARGNSYEVRIPADVAKEWFQDMSRLGNVSRVTTEKRRGFYDWRCTPSGDGTYTVKHTWRTSVFEPFKPKLRKGWVATGETEQTSWGTVTKREEAMVAPFCVACARVIQIGEVAYREQRNPHGRNWPDAVICGGCITRAPGEGIREAGARGAERG